MNNKNQKLMEKTCVWCNKLVLENTEVFGLGAKHKKGIDIKNHEGKFIPLTLTLSQKTVPALVTPSNSQAKRESNDLYFMTCSYACATSLKEALNKEVDIIGSVNMN